MADESDADEKTLLGRHKQDTSDYVKDWSTARNNCEQITLIWLDNQLVEISQFADDFRLTEALLRELNDYVLFFSDESECLTRIESIKSETVLLIVAGSATSPNLLQKTHNMRNVDSIFIFCQNKNAYEPLLLNKDYHKLMGIFNEQVTLASSIANAIEIAHKQSAIFTLYNTDKQKSARNLDRESGSFIFLQLVKQVLQKMSSNEEAMKTSKQEMLETCRLYYRGNKKAMDDIDKFDREYTSDQAIRWYTENSFMFRLINKALRTEDINALYTYRFYVNDLCACLAKESKELYESTSNIHVYRGVKMAEKEIERFRGSVDHLISVNAFFSTSRQIQVSEMYAGIGANSSEARNDLESVVFDIEVDLEKHSKTIVADVRHLSKFKDEDEVLFDVGTVFKIQSITYDERRFFWQCQMTTSDEGSTIAKEYLDLKQTKLNESNDIESAFGDLLYEMAEGTKSLVYFQKLAERRPYDPYIVFAIGRAHYVLTETDQALSHFKEAYDLCMKGANKQLSLAAKICGFTCRIHEDRGYYKEALLSGNEALELYRQVGESDNQLGIAKVLIDIGIVYYQQSNDDASSEHFQRAFSLLKNIYAFDHPDVSFCLNYLAFGHYHKGDYDKALDCMLSCLNIYQQHYPLSHPNISAAENNVGKQYYKQGKYDQALERFQHAADIYEHMEKTDSQGLAVTYNNIGKTLYRLNKLNEAIAYYEKALHLIEEYYPSATDHIDLAYTLKNMGEIHLARGDVTSALDWFERAHNMYERIFARDGDHRDIAKCKHLIALTHIELGNHDEAANAFDKALQMWTNILSKDHPDLALCHHSMAKFYSGKKDEEARAILNFETALSIYEKRMPADHQDLIDMRNNLLDFKQRHQPTASLSHNFKQRSFVYMNSRRNVLVFCIFSSALLFFKLGIAFRDWYAIR